MLHAQFFIILCLSFQTSALSYWIDGSCSGSKQIDEAHFNEVRLMASEGKNRFGDSNDQVMAASFKQIFQVDKSNAAASKMVSDAFNAISGFTATPDFKSSDVRIYCDQEARWEIVPDLPGAGKKRNSKKPDNEQQWQDPKNFIFGKKPGGCKDGTTLAQTYSIKDEKHDKGVKDGQNPLREVITICDLAFEALGQPLLLSGYPDNKDFTTKSDDDGDFKIEDLQDLMSVTIFHEACHLKSTIGIQGNGEEEAIGWENVIDLPNAAAVLKEADPFALLGLTAILNKRNFRLTADAGNAKKGWLEMITKPAKPPSRKRALRFLG